MARLKTIGFELQTNSNNREFSYYQGDSPSYITSATRTGQGVSQRTNTSSSYSRSAYEFTHTDTSGVFYSRVGFYLNSLPTSLANNDHPCGNLRDNNTVLPIHGGPGAQEYAASSFKAKYATVSAVSLRLYRNGTPLDNLTISIVSTLNGTEIGAVTVAASSIISGSWNTFIFSSPLTLIPGNTYYIQVYRAAPGIYDGVNYISWYQDYNENIFPDGSVYVHNSGSWTNQPASCGTFSVLYQTNEISIVALGGINNTYTGYISLNTSGAMQLYDWFGIPVGSPSSNIATGAWHYLEIKIDIPNKILEWKLDGTQVATTSSAVLQNFGNLSWGPESASDNGVDGWTGYETGTVDIYWDDIAINDNSGSSQNSYPGNGYVYRLSPAAAGDSNTFTRQTGGTAGDTNNFTRVNETTPDNATSYNGSSTLNEEDLFRVTQLTFPGGTTFAVVETGVVFRNSTADATGSFLVEIEKTTGGTKATSASIIPNSTTWSLNTITNTTPQLSPLILYKDPDTASWTPTTINSMQIGYKDTANPGTAGRRCDITTLWVYIESSAVAIPSSPTGRRGLMGVGF